MELKTVNQMSEELNISRQLIYKAIKKFDDIERQFIVKPKFNQYFLDTNAQDLIKKHLNINVQPCDIENPREQLIIVLEAQVKVRDLEIASLLKIIKDLRIPKDLQIPKDGFEMDFSFDITDLDCDD